MRVCFSNNMPAQVRLGFFSDKKAVDAMSCGSWGAAVMK